MNEVIISSPNQDFCQDSACRQIDAAIAAASRSADTQPFPLTSDNIIILTRVIEMQLLGRGVRAQHLTGTTMTYVPETPIECGAAGCAVLQLVLRRMADEWRLISVDRVNRPGGMARQCDIELSPAALIDTVQRRAA